MFCPNCGSETEDGAVFCDNCGASLLEGEAVTSVRSILPAQTTPMPSVPNAVAASAQAQQTQQMPSNEKGKPKTPIVIVVVLLALVVAAVAVVLTFGSEEQKGVEGNGTKHEIVFETFGGSRYKSESYESGTVIEMTEYPTRAGSTFEGWYLDVDLKKPVTFPYTIANSDPETITFYAKWRENVTPSSTPSASVSVDPASDSTSVLPYSSTTYLTEEDLYWLSDAQLQRAINEIYARNGYIFQQSASEKQYFESRPWYQGNEVNQDVVKSRFNQFENANVKLMQSYRDSHF